MRLNSRQASEHARRLSALGRALAAAKRQRRVAHLKARTFREAAHGDDSFVEAARLARRQATAQAQRIRELEAAIERTWDRRVFNIQGRRRPSEDTADILAAD